MFLSITYIISPCLPASLSSGSTSDLPHPILAVSQLWRDNQRALFLLAHAQKALIPARDDTSDSESKVIRTVPRPGVVEFGTVLEVADVVDCESVTFL